MQVSKNILNWGRDLLHLFFPNVCIGCMKRESDPDELFCFRCQLDLPYTGFHLQNDNLFTEHFAGRIPISFGSAIFFYYPGGKVQQLVHAMKYQNRPWMGQALGKWYGQQLKRDEVLPTWDAIVPVPLHRKKEWKRGYNQSEFVSRGLSQSTGIQVRKKALTRIQPTKSQTGLERIERIKNVEKAFLWTNDDLKDGHILLVDDVLTTGATLEACALAIPPEKNLEVSMLTIAMGRI